MTLEIKAGMFAVLRDGTVPEEALMDYGVTAYGYEAVRDNTRLWRISDALNYPTRCGVSDRPDEDIVATFATRAEALAYVADNPMNRELYPDGPDLASVPQTVRAEDMADWSDLPDVYVTSAKKIDGIFWEITACSVPMAIGPEVRLVVAPAPVVVDWQAREWDAAVAALPAVIEMCARDTLAPGQTTEDMFAAKAMLVARALVAAAKEPRHE
jgi:hypothetical protein